MIDSYSLFLETKKIKNKVDLEKLDKLEVEGLISKRKHPKYDIYICNYTPEAQYSACWTPELLLCRGLVIGTSGNIVARSFPKFFNWEETDMAPAYSKSELKNAFYTKKYDGSLILYFLYEYEPEKFVPVFASRGSFESEQAIRAAQIWEKIKPKHGYFVPKGHCVLFEVLYPENKIVVDYGSDERLVCLGQVDLEGREWPPSSHYSDNVERIPFSLESVEELKQEEKENEEGYVVTFNSGFKVKVKFSEYVRLHRIICGLSTRTIWEALKNGGDLKDVLGVIPDELYRWVSSTEAKLKSEYEALEEEAIRLYERTDSLETRKEKAEFILRENKKLASAVFSMLDKKFSLGKSDYLWKLVEPEYSRPIALGEEK